jgi:hypothetical protein
MIEVFNDLYDAILFMEVEAEFKHDYFKAELLKLDDGRWRCGITTERQHEFNFKD